MFDKIRIIYKAFNMALIPIYIIQLFYSIHF